MGIVQRSHEHVLVHELLGFSDSEGFGGRWCLGFFFENAGELGDLGFYDSESRGFEGITVLALMGSGSSGLLGFTKRALDDRYV